MKPLIMKQQPVPMFLQQELLYGCNSNCVFCYNPNRGKKVDDGRIFSLLDSIKEAHVPLVQLTGGEVTLLSKLNEFIDHLYEESNVCLVTNGILRREFSKNLGFIYVSIHGEKAVHEELTRHPGSHDKILANIGHYIREGRMVCTETVITKKNFRNIHETLKRVDGLGVHTIFVNRYEPGGLGTASHEALMPSLEEFELALRNIVDIRDTLQAKLAFCVALPFCLTDTLVQSRLAANCDAGVTLAAVNPEGGLRICNQSQVVYGNTLEIPIHEIWNRAALSEYRDMSNWIDEPCKSCPIVERCCAGCRVDWTSGKNYCVDYQIRGKAKPPVAFEKLLQAYKPKDPVELEVPKQMRKFTLRPFVRVNRKYIERYKDWKIFTRNNWVDTNELGVKIVELVKKGVTDEQLLLQEIQAIHDVRSVASVRCYLSLLSRKEINVLEESRA